MFKKYPIKTEKGIAAILVIMITAAFLVSVAALTKTLLTSLGFRHNNLSYYRAFYLAEGGLEFAKSKLAEDPSWYTDLPHSPVPDKEWAKSAAFGCLNPANIGISNGGFKIIKEKEKNRIYALGFSSLDPEKSSGCAILYMEYTAPPPKTTCWKEL